jgi:hypothetical protein
MVWNSFAPLFLCPLPSGDIAIPRNIRISPFFRMGERKESKESRSNIQTTFEFQISTEEMEEALMYQT